MIDVEEDNSDNNITKKEQQMSIKKPFYDILGYNISIAVKMTALANPNHMVIGQLVYDVLDDPQKFRFQQLDFNPAMWSYASNNSGENIYKVYTNM
jgi:adenylate cyclase